jgi:hypothetical protein
VREGARALVTCAAYEAAVSQGYQPPQERAICRGIALEGLDEPVDIVEYE